MSKLTIETKAKRASVAKEAKDMRDRVASEKRDMSPDELEKFNQLVAQVEELNKRVDSYERLDESAPDEAGEGDDVARGRAFGGDDLRDKKHTFSFVRAVNCILNGRLDGYEREVSDEIAKRSGKSPRSFFAPTQGINYRTGVVNTTTGTGAVATILSQDWIEILRNRMKTYELGATVLNDMRGNFAIPAETSASTAYWVAESTAPTASNPVLGQVTFTPHTCGAYTDISRRFLEQANNLDAEAFVRMDLSKQVAVALDAGALSGSGSSGQPTGILNNSNVPVVAIGTNGGALTYPTVLALEESVGKANADYGKLAFLTNAQVRASAKQTARIGSTFPSFIWEDNEIAGYRAEVSQNVPFNLTKGSGTALSALIFGNWETLIYAMWGALDILVDPFTGSSSGTVRIVALQDVDVNLRYNNAFANVVDIVAS